jgi:hypothetical protein
MPKWMPTSCPSNSNSDAPESPAQLVDWYNMWVLFTLSFEHNA